MTKVSIQAIAVPSESQVNRDVAGAYFHDCYERPMPADAPSAMALYLAAVGRTPAWVNALMAARNRAVTLVGLKNLGALGAIDPAKPASSYRVGDRVGIFSLLYVSENEVVLGDADKHLTVKLSLCKRVVHGRHTAAVSTVVQVHKRLGKVYMFFVAPVHKVITPVMLARALIEPQQRNRA